MRLFSLAFVVAAAVAGAAMMLPVCPSGKRTLPAEVGQSILAAGAVGASIGGGLATVGVFAVRFVAKRW
jgi:hypothetical protein